MRLDAAGRRLPPPSRGQHPDGHWWLSMAAAAKVMDRPRASCHCKYSDYNQLYQIGCEWCWYKNLFWGLNSANAFVLINCQ